MAGVEVTVIPEDPVVWCGNGMNIFSCYYNKDQIIFDYGDAKELAGPSEVFFDVPVFKFHYCGNYPKNVFPFVPMLSLDWKKYNKTRLNVHYKAEGSIFCKQRPYGNAVTRRLKVLSLLESEYGPEVDYSLTSQEEFWESFNDCFISVCVPGQREDILDRAQLEAMGLGVCTISPVIEENLVGLTLEPFYHYVPVKNDFSDLSERISWCKFNPFECIKIGQHAKELFDIVYSPNTLRWFIEDCIDRLTCPLPNIPLPNGRLFPRDELLLLDYGKGTSVDLGTYLGRSAALLAQGSDIVISIDRFPTCDEPAYSFPAVAEILKILAPNVYLFKGDSADEARMIREEAIDVIFIDANHTYSSVEKDIVAWYSKMKKGGYIIFHDYVPIWPEVVKCVDHYSEKFNLKFVEKKGYCIVFQKGVV